MAEEDRLPLPLDIPWQLLSRRGPDSSEDPTSLATFVYVPRLEELDAAYPDDRLIYFKFSASVFPFRLDLPAEPPLDVLDEAFAPVWRLMLDVQIRPRGTPEPRELKPYFLSAAPVRRTIVETGVVGDHLTEGESDEVAVGRSGAQMIEGFHSTVKTRKFSRGILPLGIGFSYSSGTTSITGGREVTENVDTTSREASTERRELLSHMTNVNNVLTLLTGSLVGTHSLRFSLWPQPLRPLSLDPNDENLWYAELLKRRSSGVEGMQDLFAVAVVPRGEGFCLDQTLRRVSVLEPPLPEPPAQPSYPFDTFDFDADDFARVLGYVSGKYPQGTPLEELDVAVEDKLLADPAILPPFPTSLKPADLKAWFDAVGRIWVPNPLPPFPEVPLPSVLKKWAAEVKAFLASPGSAVKIDAIPRPVVSEWTFSLLQPPSTVRLHALTWPPTLPFAYKWVQDVWLEAVQYEYERELGKSPLERGTVLLDDRKLDTCVSVDPDGVIRDVTTTIPSQPPVLVLPPLPLPPGAAFPGTGAGHSIDVEPRSKGRRLVSAWGLLESYLGTIAGGAPREAGVPLTFEDPRLAELFLRRAARLSAADRRNQRLADIAAPLGLTQAHVKALTAAGATNLSSLASSILAAREVAERAPEPRARPVSSKARLLPPALAAELLRSIGRSLDALYRRGRSSSPRPDRRRVSPARRPRKR